MRTILRAGVECGLADPRFASDLAQALAKLTSPSAAADLYAGLLDAALDVLEAKFCRLLAEHSTLFAMQDSSKLGSITPPRIPVAAQFAEPTVGAVADFA